MNKQLQFNISNVANRWFIEPFFILLTTLYFFILSEGNIIMVFVEDADTINLLFTLWMVVSTWWIFKKVNRRLMFRLGSKPLLILCSVGILSLYALVVNWFYIEHLWKEHLADTHFFDRILPMAGFTFLLWNIGYLYLPKNQGQEKQNGQSTETNKSDVRHLVSSMGKSHTVLPLDQVACVFIEDRFVFAFTFSAKKYVLNESLNQLEENLTAHSFFRINRQVIVARKAVQGFKVANNQKLAVAFTGKEASNNEGYVSRYKSPDFKKWFKS